MTAGLAGRAGLETGAGAGLVGLGLAEIDFSEIEAGLAGVGLTGAVFSGVEAGLTGVDSGSIELGAGLATGLFPPGRRIAKSRRLTVFLAMPFNLD